MSNIFFSMQAENLGFVEDILLVSEDENISIKAIVTRNSRSSADFKGFKTNFYPYEVMIESKNLELPIEKQTKFIIIDKKNRSKTITITLQQILYSEDDMWVLGCI